jgi:hypothetical protein
MKLVIDIYEQYYRVLYGNNEALHMELVKTGILFYSTLKKSHLKFVFHSFKLNSNCHAKLLFRNKKDYIKYYRELGLQVNLKLSGICKDKFII